MFRAISLSELLFSMFSSYVPFTVLYGFVDYFEAIRIIAYPYVTHVRNIVQLS
jgi:hypothetical protein